MTENKIILVIIGGLGGVQSGPNMLTELQQAHKPNLNALMRKSICGLVCPAEAGKTPSKSTALAGLLGCSGRPQQTFAKRFHRKALVLTSDPVMRRVAARCSIPVRICASGVAAVFAAIDRGGEEILILHIPDAEPFGLQKEYYDKIKILEDIDRHLPELQALDPAVLCVTGDVTLPTAVGRITWHPAPVMIQAKNGRYDMVQSFDEISCSQGGLHVLHSTQLMPLLLAHADCT
ncbi:MAG TPA: hypothetical protein PK843_05225 [bacterium]|nr:hypothetical protein [bacterium]